MERVQPGDIRDICSECGAYRSLGHYIGCPRYVPKPDDADYRRDPVNQPENMR